MPRVVRKQSLTQTYHVMLRGINKENILLDICDNKKFLQILKLTKEKYQFQLYGYCLMKNHIHLLLRHKNVSLVMKSIAGRYANYFNNKYNRIGHLFQDRFKSKAIEDRAYLKSVLRYIHRNPDKASICEIDKYKWSSYNEYLKQSNKNIIDRNLCLSLFKDNQKDTIYNFKMFMMYNNYEDDWKDEIEFELIEKITDEKLVDIIKGILKIQDINEIVNFEKTERNEAIKKILKINHISYNQISRVIGINPKIIQRLAKGIQ